MDDKGCNDDDDCNNGEWEVPNYHKKKAQRKNRPNRPQQQQDGPRYTVIVKPTTAMKITNVDSWLLWSTFRKLLKSPCESDQLGYTVNNRNNFIAITVQTEHHAEDLMALKELPTEDPNKTIQVTVYRSTTGSQPRGIIHGVSPGDAARGIVDNAIADYHDIIHSRPLGKNGTYLITFEGRGIPRSIRLFGKYHTVFPYKPTAVICLQCHELGHMTTVCTGKQRCKSCGEIHPTNQPCQGKYCPNCRKTGHTVFEAEACRARNRADDKLQKRAAAGRRNYNSGVVTAAKGRTSARATFKPDDFPSLPIQRLHHQPKRDTETSYSQVLAPKAMNTDVSHIGPPTNISSRMAVELAQLKESSRKLLEKIQQLEVKYEKQLRQEQEEARKAQAKTKAESDRKRRQEAEHQIRVEQQKADEARRRAQRCAVTYEQVIERKRKEAEAATAKATSAHGARASAPTQQDRKELFPPNAPLSQDSTPISGCLPGSPLSGEHLLQLVESRLQKWQQQLQQQLQQQQQVMMQQMQQQLQLMFTQPGQGPAAPAQ